MVNIHSKLNTETHEFHKISGIDVGVPKWYAVFLPLVAYLV